MAVSAQKDGVNLLNCILQIILAGIKPEGSGNGAPRPFTRDGNAQKFRGNPTAGPIPKVWTRDSKMEEVVPQMARQ